MNLQSLLIFWTAAHKESFKAAADELLYSQSNITMTIKQLEAEWGVKLFEKRGRGVKLTQDGRSILGKVTSILREVESLNKIVREIDVGDAGHIRIGAIEPVGSWRIAPLVAEFSKSRPLLQINFESGSFYSISDRVQNGELDIGITQTPLYWCTLPFEPLYVERMTLLMRDDHPLAQQTKVHITELRDVRLMLTETIISHTAMLENKLSIYGGTHPYAGIEVNSLPGLVHFVQQGVGIAVVPEWASTEVPDNIVARKVDGYDFEMTIGFLYRALAPKQKVLEEFINFARGRLQDL